MNLRQRQLKRFIVTLAVVVAAHFVYATGVVPLIEGPPRKRLSTSPSDDFDPQRFKADLLVWLPADGWERGSCKQLSTRSGDIFYQEYRPFDDGRIELKPLTIILPSAGAASIKQPPIILRAPEGAVLKLDHPLSLGGKSVQLEAGQLLGPVTVYRAESKAGANDAWLIQTNNIQLSKQKIQTIEAVEFQFGPHFGSGRNLVIDLEADPLRAQQRSMTGIRGVQRIDLVQIERLHLTPAAETAAASPAENDATPNPASQNIANANQYSIVEKNLNPVSTEAGLNDYPNGFDVTCNGSFELNMETGLATLRDDVKIVSCDVPTDGLTADVIELQLGNGADPRPDFADSEKSAGGKITEKQWSLQSIVAVGRPATLSATSCDLLVRGERLKYDLTRSMIDVRGSRGIELRQGNLELASADAQYQIMPDGSLGTALLTGPGLLRRGAVENQPPLEIRWQDNLAIGAEADQKTISLVGGAQVLMDGQSQFSADQLRVWLWELPTARNSADSNRWNWQPDRLMAAGHVRVESAKISGAVDELRAQWPPPADPTIQSAQSNSVAGVPSRGLAPIQDTPQRAAPAAGVLDEPVDEQPKVNFRGQRATVQLLDAAAGQFKEIVIDGDVRVQQISPAGAVALDITGQQLRISPQDEQRFRLSVSGGPDQPSRVQAQQLTLVGQTVQLNQSANRLWIDGPGSMHAEQSAGDASEAANSQGAELPANAIGSPTTVDVRWSGGMVFNGEQIYFENDVVTTCLQSTAEGNNQIEAHSAAINISIQPKVDLAGAQSSAPAERPQIKILTLIGAVPSAKRVFAAGAASDNRTEVSLQRQALDASGQIVSVQQLAVPWGQVDATTGQLNMTGPGSVSIWSVGGGTDLAVPTAAPAKSETAASGLTNTQIRFEESITGNIRQTELVFNGKVRTVHGPVDDWQTSLDADRTQPTGSVFRLRSDHLQITQWQREAAELAHVEIIALGQARLNGETFEAIAERIGYNQSQEKVILEGDPRNGAQLNYQSAPGQPRNPLVASKIAYNLRDHTVQVDGFKQGVLTTGPVLQKR